jgi:hypothetical protein
MTVERERQSQAREDREHGAKGVSRLREVEDGEERRHQERDQRREPERETHHRGMSEPVDRGDHDSMAGSRRAVREHDAPLLRPDETRCARVAGADAGARPQIDRAQPWRWRTLAGRQQMTRWTPGSCRSSPRERPRPRAARSPAPPWAWWSLRALSPMRRSRLGDAAGARRAAMQRPTSHPGRARARGPRRRARTTPARRRPPRRRSSRPRRGRSRASLPSRPLRAPR